MTLPATTVLDLRDGWCHSCRRPMWESENEAGCEQCLTELDRDWWSVVMVDPDTCPDCGAPSREVTVDEAALVAHAGYGETRRTTVRSCSLCDWWMTSAVESIATRNPQATS